VTRPRPEGRYVAALEALLRRGRALLPENELREELPDAPEMVRLVARAVQEVHRAESVVKPLSLWTDPHQKAASSRETLEM